MTCLPPSGTKKLLVSKGVGNFEVCLQPAFVGRLFLRDPMFVQFEGVPAFFRHTQLPKAEIRDFQVVM